MVFRDAQNTRSPDGSIAGSAGSVVYLSNVRGMAGLKFIAGMLLVLSLSAARAQHTLQPVDEIRKSIYFGGGSYYVDDLQIEDLYHWLDSIPNLERYAVQLISHTDPIGGIEYNKWLSQMRSASVRDLLLRKEIDEHRISVKDWGLENALYSNRTWGGRAMNRRVDVILHPLTF
jgi:outer membrane protein OmpA-like peptidoglycan-associated protein